ncbi:hypothetical protein NUW58_g7083 [Xylaria curta]|uniref:Uncharacterized protein n=1 Tax=Xylaria curta TaxID=42375 RepID=A0ACC1NM70_9PEZI|nr:hypothetical protein NUW58_g7083 [Xylaria curta]
MSVTQEQAGTVRLAHEIRELPTAQVPAKPTVSRLENSPRVDPDTGIPHASHPERRTVEVKANILQKLLKPEGGTVHDLGIKKVDGQFSDKEAEKQYEDFIKQLMIWSRDLAQPQNDPFHEFNEYHTFTFKKVYREIPVPNNDSELRPYICIVGFKNEVEVKRAFCYDLDGGLLSDMPSASFLRDTQRHTLCGSLVFIGEGRERRIVTIGGLVTDGKVTWALTAGHLPKEAQQSRSDPEALTENDLDVSDYGEDVEPPLILRGTTISSDTELDPPTSDKPEGSNPAELGDVEISGGDRSLIQLKHETLALPNCATSEDQQPGYLFKYTEGLLWDNSNTKYLGVTVLGGVTGPSQVHLLNNTSPMRLPGGKWINVWVADAQSESQLQRGDSGSWVVDIKNGIVYGHVLSISGRTIYILSLAHIFHEISEKAPTMTLDLVQPAFQNGSTTNSHRVSEFIQWASSNLSIKVGDSIYYDFPLDFEPDSIQTPPRPEKPAEQWDASFSLGIAAPGPSQVSSVNLSTEKLQGKGRSPDRLHKKHPKGEDWEANFALDTPIDEWLFLEQISSLKSNPQPASYLEILNSSDPSNSVVESREFSDGELETFLTNKVTIVTGSNTGLGKEIAQILYSKNAKVYMLARSEEKTKQAIESIKAAVPESSGELIYLHLDLADLPTIKATVDEFHHRESQLHLLINNAGVAFPQGTLPSRSS